MADIDTLFQLVADPIRKALEEAYAAGYAAGKLEGLRDFRAKLDRLMESDTELELEVRRHAAHVPVPEVTVSQGDGERRPPGSVKPAILELIRSTPGGLTISEIRERTGFKHNSVRGTVWDLKSRELIQSVDGRWVASPTPAGADNEPTVEVGGSDQVKPATAKDEEEW